ncbi:MAG: SDR family NAD(P)-dependent oxidoreductase [Oscillochloridaceae bacterium umkhey_bin13]
MSGRLAGKVALVTGVGSSGPGWGIGKAIAALFAREGAKVYGLDLNLAAAEETQALIREEGGQCLVRQVDVTDEAVVRAAVADCIAQFGGLDVLVNNVGNVTVGGAVELSSEQWRRVLEINLTSMFLTSKYAIPAMQQAGKGSLVHIGSIAGIRWTGVPYISYSSTKAAVLGLSRSIALEHARSQIRSNVIMPGLMHTPFIVEPLKGVYGEGDLDRMIEVRNQQCPMGHMGDAWDVAYAALFLASDEAKYITGTELVVDGGITAKFV